MPATPEQMKYARSWIGNAEPDHVFDERVDRLRRVDRTRNIDLAIEESLRAQHAAMVMDQPADIMVEDIRISYAANLKALEDKLEEFMKTAGSLGPSVTRLDRRTFR